MGKITGLLIGIVVFSLVTGLLWFGLASMQETYEIENKTEAMPGAYDNLNVMRESWNNTATGIMAEDPTIVSTFLILAKGSWGAFRITFASIAMIASAGSHALVGWFDEVVHNMVLSAIITILTIIIIFWIIHFIRGGGPTP